MGYIIVSVQSNKARALHIKRNRFWEPVSFDQKFGRQLHQTTHRKPAEVSLFSFQFVSSWETSASREREEEIHWETCWHVWQICRVINSLNADTATGLDFTKIVPRKFHLGFRSCQFLIYPLVWMAPFLKENQQLLDTDARCIGSQTAEQTPRKHSTPAITPSPGCTRHDRKKLLWELQETKRLSD